MDALAGGLAAMSGRMVGSWAVSSPARVEVGGVAKAHSVRYGKDTAQTQVRIRNPRDTGGGSNTPKLCFSPPELVSPHNPQDPDEHRQQQAVWTNGRPSRPWIHTLDTLQFYCVLDAQFTARRHEHELLGMQHRGAVPPWRRSAVHGFHQAVGLRGWSVC